jgi:CRP-like cAMP-binding protein
MTMDASLEPMTLSLKPATLMQMLEANAWFSQCPQDMRDGLIEKGRIYHLEPGQAMFAAGHVPYGLFCVLEGGLKIQRMEGGRPSRLLFYVGPAQWAGDSSMIEDVPCNFDGMCDVPTSVLVIERAVLLDWLDEHPRYWREVAKLTCRKQRTLFHAIEDISYMPLQQRIARQLLHAFGHDKHDLSSRRPLQLPQEHFALMLGVSRQSINKELRKIEKMGLISLGYAQIELLDAQGLAGLARQAPDVAERLVQAGRLRRRPLTSPRI